MIVYGSGVHQKEILTCPVLFHFFNISFMYHFSWLHCWGGSISCIRPWDWRRWGSM